MRKYWWVNHARTSKHERNGNYLWSPKTNQNDAFNRFYANMREASPGDYVLSFAHGLISHVGQVTEFAFDMPKPLEFGKSGENWAAQGWLLPVAWKQLKTPVKPKLFIDELVPHLPDKYSPMKANGNGNEVYLAEINLKTFQLVLSKCGIDLDLAFEAPELAEIFGDYATELDQAIERQLSISPELSATEISQLIKARRGQGIFRANVRKFEQSCRLTGIANPLLLIASHIKPWRACRDSLERLDGNNGLLLTPHVDLLFDRGFISFTDEGALLVSPKIPDNDMTGLGIEISKISPRIFNPQQRGYLDYHRSNVFIDELKSIRPTTARRKNTSV